MKNSQKGFIVPALLVIIALLVIGGGVYVYENKKTKAPTTVDTINQRANTQTPPVTIQNNGNTLKNKAQADLFQVYIKESNELVTELTEILTVVSNSSNLEVINQKKKEAKNILLSINSLYIPSVDFSDLLIKRKNLISRLADETFTLAFWKESNIKNTNVDSTNEIIKATDNATKTLNELTDQLEYINVTSRKLFE